MPAEAHYLRKHLQDPRAKEVRMARIEQLEDEVFERATGIVGAILSFHEVDPSMTEPPPAWVEEYGAEGAMQRLKVAQAAWLRQADAPSGFKYAVQVMAGISRGRAYRVKVTQNNLNVKMTLPLPTTTAHPGPTTYEVRDLDP